MRNSVLISAAAILAATATPAIAGSYTITVLAPLPGFTRGAVGDQSYGINNAGQSVGRMTNGPNGDRAAVWDSSGHVTQLATPQGTWWSKADSINNAGVMTGDIGVGTPGDQDSKRAVRWVTPGTYEFFLPDNGHTSFADVSNDNGYIGGIRYSVPNDGSTYDAYVWSPNGVTRWIDATVVGRHIEWFGVNNSNAFAGGQSDPNESETGANFDAVIWDETKGVTILSGLGGYFRVATDINNSGIVVGTEWDGDLTDTGLWWDANHVLNRLGFVVGTTTSIPTALNDFGVVTGWSGDSATCDGFTDFTCRRATIWDLNGHATDLNSLIDPDLGYTLLFANAINSAGQIQGEAINRSGQRFLFLATLAVPEASTWAMFLAGFGILGARLRARHSQNAYPLSSKNLTTDMS